MLSGINAYHLMASRIPFAMSRDGLLPRQLGRANQGGTPSAALLLAVATSIGLIALAKVFERALAITAFYFVTDYAFAYTGVFVLRLREPDAARPYRAWGYPWTTGIALVGSIAFLVGALIQDTTNSLWAIGVLAACYPLYLLTKLAKKT